MRDLLVVGALIVDGTGDPGLPGSVAVEGDRIAGVIREGEPEPSAAVRIDGSGLVLAPGFIDVHDHSDLSTFVDPWMQSSLRQGVTTVVAGNCGLSGAPANGAREWCAMADQEVDASWDSFAGFLEALDGRGPAINVATLAGHGTIREAVLGGEPRAPSRTEMARMRALLAEALDAGAVGLSTGLIYAPGFHATTAEIVELAAELAGRGGVYASHIRGEGGSLFDAVDEAVEVGRRAGVPVEISHLKCESEPMWGRAGELLERIAAGRRSGVDVGGDQYPYPAYGTDLASFLPPWAPVDRLDLVLSDPVSRERLEHVMAEGEGTWQSSVKGVGWDRVVITRTAGHPEHAGTSVAAIAEDLGVDPFDAVFRMLRDDPATAIVGHAMHEEDVRTILAAGDVAVGADSTAERPPETPGGSPVHPRTYGTFPRILGRYVREEGLLTLESAVRKMTSLSADRFRLAGRGRIEPGAFADLVLFDPERVADTATYEEPHRFPEGIRLVVVNGRIAWDGSEYGTRAGRVLRRGAR